MSLLTDHVTFSLNVLRGCNVALYAWAMLMFTVRIASSWPRLTRGRRLLMGSFDLILVGIMSTSSVNYIEQVRASPTIVLFSVAGVGIITALFISRNDRDRFNQP